MRKFILAMSLLAIVLFSATGCTNTSNNNLGSGSDGKPKINIIGSTSVTPLVEELSKNYNTAIIDIQGVGSSAGIKAIIDETCDIGMSSRELKDSEKTSLIETSIALDAIAVVVNPKNQVSNLTTDQVSKIFKGEIKNWKELGGNDREIIVVSRESGAGTRTAFEELMGLQKDIGDGKKISLVDDSFPIITEGNGSVKQNVSSKENAIGYISLGIVDTNIKAVRIDGIEANDANVKNSLYPISRPFLLLTKSNSSQTAKNFLDFILSDAGQKIVEDMNFISVK